MDAVSDRDFALEFLNCLATIMMHLSRLCEEIVVWCTGEFGFIELHDSLATGSSMMPQKKNPDFAELIRGKTGRVYGSLLSLYTVMKGLPLTYNKDMQEDKECVFDSLDTVLGSLRLSADMIRTCKVNSATMRQAASAGFTNATDVADYLSRKGLPFRDAHEVVGHLVRYCLARATELDRISLAEYKQHSTLFEEDIYDAIKLEAVVARRSSYGGTGPAAVEQQLDHIRTRHADNQKWVGARREQIRVK
jgi:argininosuccinate lyase